MKNSLKKRHKEIQKKYLTDKEKYKYTDLISAKTFKLLEDFEFDTSDYTKLTTYKKENR
jgi:hypothetical protein